MTNTQTAQAELIAVFRYLFATRSRDAQLLALEVLDRVESLESGNATPHRLTDAELREALNMAKAWRKERGRAA